MVFISKLEYLESTRKITSLNQVQGASGASVSVSANANYNNSFASARASARGVITNADVGTLTNVIGSRYASASTAVGYGVAVSLDRRYRTHVALSSEYDAVFSY